MGDNLRSQPMGFPMSMLNPVKSADCEMIPVISDQPVLACAPVFADPRPPPPGWRPCASVRVIQTWRQTDNAVRTRLKTHPAIIGITDSNREANRPVEASLTNIATLRIHDKVKPDDDYVKWPTGTQLYAWPEVDKIRVSRWPPTQQTVGLLASMHGTPLIHVYRNALVAVISAMNAQPNAPFHHLLHVALVAIGVPYENNINVLDEPATRALSAFAGFVARPTLQELEAAVRVRCAAMLVDSVARAAAGADPRPAAMANVIPAANAHVLRAVANVPAPVAGTPDTQVRVTTADAINRTFQIPQIDFTDKWNAAHRIVQFAASVVRGGSQPAIPTIRVPSPTLLFGSNIFDVLYTALRQASPEAQLHAAFAMMPVGSPGVIGANQVRGGAAVPAGVAAAGLVWEGPPNGPIMNGVRNSIWTWITLMTQIHLGEFVQAVGASTDPESILQPLMHDISTAATATGSRFGRVLSVERVDQTDPGQVVICLNM